MFAFTIYVHVNPCTSFSFRFLGRIARRPTRGGGGRPVPTPPPADVAAGQVVVDQAERLHGRVHGGGAHEPEPAPAQLCDEGDRLGAGGGQVAHVCRDRPRRRLVAPHQRASDPSWPCTSSVARALAMVASILPRWRTMPASTSSRSTSAGPKRATAAGSNPAKPWRKPSRLRRMVSHDRPAWKPSRHSFSNMTGCRRRPGGPTPRRGSGGTRAGSTPTGSAPARRRPGRRSRAGSGHRSRTAAGASPGATAGCARPGRRRRRRSRAGGPRAAGAGATRRPG